MSIFYMMLESHTLHVKAIANWLFKTAEALGQDAPALKQAADAGQSGSSKLYKFHSGIKSGLTSFDLEALQPALEKLFESCRVANIALELAGFDQLSCGVPVPSGGISFYAGPGDFLVSVDAGREFNFATNPFSGRAAAEEKNEPGKPSAPPPNLNF